MARNRCLSVMLVLVTGLATAAVADQSAAPYDADAALSRSQAAIGRTLQPLELRGSDGLPMELQELRGKPVLVSMIFTSCYHVCPAITRHLANAVEAARQALGEDSFYVVTIGFDTPNDTPTAMASFARAQKISEPGWHFLSGDAESMAALTENLGFSYFPTPRGFDHINQVTLVDRDGVIYGQVYGAAFELPALVEPLKELVYNRPQPGSHLVSNLVDRFRLFCTVYDPATGRYRFDYSLFVQIAIGGIFLLVLGGWWLRETIKARRSKMS